MISIKCYNAEIVVVCASSSRMEGLTKLIFFIAVFSISGTCNFLHLEIISLQLHLFSPCLLLLSHCIHKRRKKFLKIRLAVKCTASRKLVYSWGMGGCSGGFSPSRLSYFQVKLVGVTENEVFRIFCTSLFQRRIIFPGSHGTYT